MFRTVRSIEFDIRSGVSLLHATPKLHMRHATSRPGLLTFGNLVIHLHRYTAPGANMPSLETRDEDRQAKVSGYVRGHSRTISKRLGKYLDYVCVIIIGESHKTFKMGDES